jgi:hypothetical protein
VRETSLNKRMTVTQGSLAWSPLVLTNETFLWKRSLTKSLSLNEITHQHKSIILVMTINKCITFPGETKRNGRLIIRKRTGKPHERNGDLFTRIPSSCYFLLQHSIRRAVLSFILSPQLILKREYFRAFDRVFSLLLDLCFPSSSHFHDFYDILKIYTFSLFIFVNHCKNVYPSSITGFFCFFTFEKVWR